MTIAIGTIIVVGTLLWIVAYHIERYSNNSSYSFTFNMGWWLPVSIFLFPGIMFLVQGNKIYKSEPLAPVAIMELIIVIIILGIIVVLLPSDNSSYIERVKKLEEQKNSRYIEENSGSIQND